MHTSHIYIYSYNGHRCCHICGIFGTSACPGERNPSSVALLPASLKGFLNSSLTQFEGLETEGVTTVQIVNPPESNNVGDSKSDNRLTTLSSPVCIADFLFGFC